MTGPIGQPVAEHTPLHPVDATDLLYKAGFRYGHKLVEAVATFWAESDLGRWQLGPLNFAVSPHVLIANPDGSYDRSWVMVNSRAHPQYPDDRLLEDPAYAAQVAWEISGHGASLTAWAAYTSGRHKRHMVAARYAVALHAALKLGQDHKRVADIALYTGAIR